MDGETLGSALRRWRESRKLSLRRLSRMINVDHTYLWEIETGRKAGTVEVAQLCDDALCAESELVRLAQGQPIDLRTLNFSPEWSAVVGTVMDLSRGTWNDVRP